MHSNLKGVRGLKRLVESQVALIRQSVIEKYSVPSSKWKLVESKASVYLKNHRSKMLKLNKM